MFLGPLQDLSPNFVLLLKSTVSLNKMTENTFSIFLTDTYGFSADGVQEFTKVKVSIA